MTCAKFGSYLAVWNRITAKSIFYVICFTMGKLWLKQTILCMGGTTEFQDMMTSSNGNIFRVTGHLCGEFTSPGEFPTQRPVTRGFDVFFDLRLNKRLSKQPWGWWFETPSWSLWRQCNVLMLPTHASPTTIVGQLIHLYQANILLLYHHMVPSALIHYSIIAMKVTVINTNYWMS